MAPFWTTNIGKTLKTTIYLSLSAAVGSLISAIANDPGLFGPSTFFVNIGLVFVKQTFLDSETPNL